MSDPNLVTLTPEPFAFLTRECVMDDIGKTVSDAFATLWAAVAQAKAAAAGPPMARFKQVGDGRVTIDLGVPVRNEALGSLRAAGLNTGMTSGGQAMRGVHVGDYATLRETYGVLLAAIRRAGRAPADEMWERYYSRPDDSEAHTEVLWPLKPALASFE